ncbi:MAG TPA: metalloregulator ArsR/SmtB family transcription factor [Acidimicrobiales bacterium]|nr:metalloregulator ArsR/SmtB family transcription factor [Acidimicrobiales bacterium]
MSNVTEVLTALADPTRRDLLERLSLRGEATATALAGDLPISRQAVVQHLAVLDRVGLVRGRRHGREHRFIVRTEPLSDTVKWMEKLSLQWDRRLKIIQQIAEASTSSEDIAKESRQRESRENND